MGWLLIRVFALESRKGNSVDKHQALDLRCFGFYVWQLCTDSISSLSLVSSPQLKMNPNDTAPPPPMSAGVPMNDGGFVYRYRHMGGGLTSAWLGAGR